MAIWVDTLPIYDHHFFDFLNANFESYRNIQIDGFECHFMSINKFVLLSSGHSLCIIWITFERDRSRVHQNLLNNCAGHDIIGRASLERNPQLPSQRQKYKSTNNCHSSLRYQRWHRDTKIRAHAQAQIQKQCGSSIRISISFSQPRSSWIDIENYNVIVEMLSVAVSLYHWINSLKMEILLNFIMKFKSFTLPQ